MIHLHVHTEFSLLDGLGDIHDYVGRAKKLKQPALAITDHGNLCGSYEFYRACRSENIEPILGSEMYFVPDAQDRPVKGSGEKAERFHVVMLARGEAGYRTLSELSTESFRNFYYKPLIDRRTLEALGKDAGNLTVLSGCAASIISRSILRDDMEAAEAEVIWWRETFPHFYIELQHHQTSFDRKLNKQLVRLANKFKIPWVITNDPHFVTKEDCSYHDALLAIQTGSDLDDPNRLRFDGEGYHLRSKKEMEKVWSKYPEVVWKKGRANTVRIAKDCVTRIPSWEKRTWHIPKYPDVPDSYEELKRLTIEGLKTKGLFDKPEYVKQAKEELRVIKEVGISDFLMITRDCIRWAEEQGIPVGPGRGSVAGTLVGYCVGIHKIDPVKYRLLFERFLNPARPRMPDIDIDFGQERRSEVFEYIANKYGKENVIHICTYQRMKVKAAFKSLAKAHGISFPDANRISKEIADDDDDGDSLPAEVKRNYPDLTDQLKRLSGTKRAISTHPAGVIVAAPEMKIHELVPEMFLPSTKHWVAQFDLDAVESMGLMKQDILGLRTLDTIKECVRLIKDATGEEIDPDSWIPDEEDGDDQIYKMLGEGKTAGVFQMEGPTNQRGIKEIKPICFEDIVSCTSLYRTGAISAGFPEIFLRHRHGGGEVAHIHPLLEGILGETFGVVLYQEQVMEIGRVLAGFSMEEVDDIKEAIKHKKSTLMDSMKPRFIQGCRDTNGIDPETASEVWRMIEGYSGYGYNRSHAVAYTLITYQTARLKKFYPAEYITALLQTVDDKDKIQSYLVEATEMGLKLLPPDINRSDRKATAIHKKGAIRFGLLDIAGIGPKVCDKILEARSSAIYEGKFKTVDEVKAAVNNSKVMKDLQKGGALRKLGLEPTRQELEESLGWQFHDTMAEYRKRYGNKAILPNGSASPVCLIGEIFKIDRGTTKKGDPFLTWKIRWSPSESFDVRLWKETQEFWDTPKGSIVAVEGEWEPRWMNVSVAFSDCIEVLQDG